MARWCCGVRLQPDLRTAPGRDQRDHHRSNDRRRADQNRHPPCAARRRLARDTHPDAREELGRRLDRQRLRDLALDRLVCGVRL
ncbi:MAG: hypothetical protein DMF91_16245 [Acidobacteria bacterium]|nr:MAG: hypothetical protein DMF91_16245 [Acidobacteriota bacterium]